MAERKFLRSERAKTMKYELWIYSQKNYFQIDASTTLNTLILIYWLERAPQARGAL